MVAPDPPTRLPLTPRRILEAALSLIDERGLDELTMRGLGASLGVEAMSIYKHLPGKDAVLDGVVGLLLEELEQSAIGGQDWRSGLADFARRFRALSVRHPSAFSLLTRRSVGAYVVGRRMTEDVLSGMVAAGFSAPAAVRSLRLVVRYVLGFALSDPVRRPTDDVALDEAVSPLGDDYPLTAALVGAMGAPGDEDALFEHGLVALIEGLGAPFAPR